MQTSDFWTRITSLCRSPTSPVIFCMQNSVPSIRNTSLHVSQPSCVVFGCKTATYGPEKQVSMGPRHDLSLCECKSASLASDLLVSMCPKPHLCFFNAIQRILDQNFKSLWVPDLICGLSTHNCELNTRIKRQYWIQPSPVALCMQNSDFRPRITSLWGSKTSPVVFAYKTASSGPEYQVSMGHRHDLSFCACTTAGLTSDLLFSMCPSPLQWFLHAKQRD